MLRNVFPVELFGVIEHLFNCLITLFYQNIVTTQQHQNCHAGLSMTDHKASCYSRRHHSLDEDVKSLEVPGFLPQIDVFLRCLDRCLPLVANDKNFSYHRPY